LGGFNTRDRDYADLYRLLDLHNLVAIDVLTAISATAAHRGVAVRRLRPQLDGFAAIRQNSYAAWRRRQGQGFTSYPADFADLITRITAFSDPLLHGDTVTHWSAADNHWHT
jgi:hypothetical protein